MPEKTIINRHFENIDYNNLTCKHEEYFHEVEYLCKNSVTKDIS